MLRLLAEHSAGVLEALGSKVDLWKIEKALRVKPVETARLFRRDEGVQVEYPATDEVCGAAKVVLRIGENCRVEVSLPGAFFSDGRIVNPPSVSVLFSHDGRAEGFSLQGPPDCSPAEVIIALGPLRPAVKRVSDYFAYVQMECHYSSGAKWSPKSGGAAEIRYYQSGETQCKTRYLQGKTRSSDSNLPCFESFWEDGSPQVVEYGTEERGRFRAADAGPAYAEYFPNGVAALEIFTRIDARGRVRASRWTCRSVDGKERPHTYGDLEIIQSKRISPVLPEDGQIGNEYDPTLELFRDTDSPMIGKCSPVDDSPSIWLGGGFTQCGAGSSRRKQERPTGTIK